MIDKDANVVVKSSTASGMLPSLGRLSLVPPTMPLPTGEFYALPESEAGALNANGGREPLTYDDYPIDRGRDDEGATFRLFWDNRRVLKNPPGHRAEGEVAAQALYAVYDAKALWDWVSKHDKDPTNSFQISHEDWMELYAKYGHDGPIPDFAETLPRLAWPDFGPNTTWVWEESGVWPFGGTSWTGGRWRAKVDGALRFATKENYTEWSEDPKFKPSDGLYFDGPPGQERLVMYRFLGESEWFSGEPGKERNIYTRFEDGATTEYGLEREDGSVVLQPNALLDARRGRVTRTKSPDGLTSVYYKGRKGHERIDYSEEILTDAALDLEMARRYFQGEAGQETVYKMERYTFSSGLVHDTHYFRVETGAKYVWKRVLMYGITQAVILYEGNRGHEAIRKVEEYAMDFNTREVQPLPYATKDFEGPVGQERLVRIRNNKGLDDTEDENTSERYQRLFRFMYKPFSLWGIQSPIS
jgi:hypothetical protein